MDRSKFLELCEKYIQNQCESCMQSITNLTRQASALFQNKTILLPPSKREREAKLFLHYLFNPHLMLKAINLYRKFHKLESHHSLTSYTQDLKIGTVFPEANDDRLCKYHVYEKVTAQYIGRAGVPVEYSRTTRVDDCKPVKYLVQTILENGSKCLKHSLYVGNCKTVLPLMKENYNGKFIEFGFSQNLSLRPKDEAQSAHFFRENNSLYIVR